MWHTHRFFGNRNAIQMGVPNMPFSTARWAFSISFAYRIVKHLQIASNVTHLQYALVKCFQFSKKTPTFLKAVEKIATALIPFQKNFASRNAGIQENANSAATARRPIFETFEFRKTRTLPPPPSAQFSKLSNTANSGTLEFK